MKQATLLIVLLGYGYFGLQSQSNSTDTTDIELMMAALVDHPNHAQILSEALKIDSLSQQLNFYRGQIFARSQQGYYYCFSGEYDKALDYYQAAYHMAEEKGNLTSLGDAIAGLGYVYQEMKAYDKALAHYDRSLSIARQLDHQELAAISLNARGALYIHLNNPAAALQSLLASKAIYEDLDPSQVPTIANNIGIIYVQLGEAPKSIPYFKTYQDYVNAIKDTLKFAPIYGNLAYCYQHLGDFEQAFLHYDSSLYYSEKLAQDEVTYITYLDMSEGHRLAGNMDKALLYYQKYHELYRQVFNTQMMSQIEELEVKFDTERKERELLQSRHEVAALQVQRQRMLLLIGSLFGGLLLAGLLFYKFRTDTRRQRKFLEVQEQLAQSELKNKVLEAERLQARLANREADLTNLALDIARKNEFSEQLKAHLNALRQVEAPGIRAKLHELITFTTTHLQVSEELAFFQENVDQINQEFYQKLEQGFGKLTANEKQLAGLIRLHLSNKDIAALRGISVSSAKMNRYRLRKKLGLAATEDIAQFLQEI